MKSITMLHSLPSTFSSSWLGLPAYNRKTCTNTDYMNGDEESVANRITSVTANPACVFGAASDKLRAVVTDDLVSARAEEELDDAIEDADDDVFAEIDDDD